MAGAEVRRGVEVPRVKLWTVEGVSVVACVETLLWKCGQRTGSGHGMETVGACKQMRP